MSHGKKIIAIKVQQSQSVNVTGMTANTPINNARNGKHLQQSNIQIGLPDILDIKIYSSLLNYKNFK